jgi:hypothetical protein
VAFADPDDAEPLAAGRVGVSLGARGFVAAVAGWRGVVMPAAGNVMPAAGAEAPYHAAIVATSLRG